MSDSEVCFAYCAITSVLGALLTAHAWDRYIKHIYGWADGEFFRLKNIMNGLSDEYSRHRGNRKRMNQYLNDAKYAVDVARSRARNTGSFIPGTYRTGMVRDFWDPAVEYLEKINPDDPEKAYDDVTGMFNNLWGKKEKKRKKN